MEWDTREASILKICLKRILYSKTFLAMKNKWWLPKLTVLEKLTFQCNNFWYVKNKLSLAISYCSVRTKILIWIMSNNVRTNSFLVDLQNGAEVKQRIQSDKVKTCLSNIFSKFKKWCQKIVIPRSMNSEKVGGWHRWGEGDSANARTAFLTAVYKSIIFNCKVRYHAIWNTFDYSKYSSNSQIRGVRYSDPLWYVEETPSHVIGYRQRKLVYEEDKRSREIPDGNHYCRISNVILFTVKILTVYCHIENDNLETLFICIQ